MGFMRQASLEVIAPTVDEAVERGVSELGVPREQVEGTVLDQGGADDGEAPRPARLRLPLPPCHTPPPPAAPGHGPPPLRVVVAAGGSPERREQQLPRMARRAALQVM